MLRETQFLVGGGLVIAAGVLFAVALYLTGAGIIFFGAWIGSGITVGFGVFFVYVARGERQARLLYLAESDPNASGKPPRSPPTS